MKVDFANKTVGGFNFEFVRGLSLQAAGAAEYGECVDTVSRVKDTTSTAGSPNGLPPPSGSQTSRSAKIDSATRASARDAFLRAANYYRMAVFYASYTDSRHTGLWQHSKERFHQMIGLTDFDRVSRDRL